MTYFDDLLAKIGQSVGIYRESEGALDDYGDPASTWALQATETAIIQRAGRGNLFRRAASIAGRIDPGDFLGIFASDSVLLERDYILLGGVKYSCEKKWPQLEQEQTSHIEAHFKLMEGV